MVLDAALLNIQHYKVRNKGKVVQSKERSSALPNTSVYKLLKREPLGRPRLRSPTYTSLKGMSPKVNLILFVAQDQLNSILKRKQRLVYGNRFFNQFSCYMICSWQRSRVLIANI